MSISEVDTKVNAVGAALDGMSIFKALTMAISSVVNYLDEIEEAELDRDEEEIAECKAVLYVLKELREKYK